MAAKKLYIYGAPDQVPVEQLSMKDFYAANAARKEAEQAEQASKPKVEPPTLKEAFATVFPSKEERAQATAVSAEPLANVSALSPVAAPAVKETPAPVTEPASAPATAKTPAPVKASAPAPVKEPVPAAPLTRDEQIAATKENAKQQGLSEGALAALIAHRYGAEKSAESSTAGAKPQGLTADTSQISALYSKPDASSGVSTNPVAAGVAQGTPLPAINSPEAANKASLQSPDYSSGVAATPVATSSAQAVPLPSLTATEATPASAKMPLAQDAAKVVAEINDLFKAPQQGRPQQSSSAEPSTHRDPALKEDANKVAALFNDTPPSAQAPQGAAKQAESGKEDPSYTSSAKSVSDVFDAKSRSPSADGVKTVGAALDSLGGTGDMSQRLDNLSGPGNKSQPSQAYTSVMDAVSAKESSSMSQNSVSEANREQEKVARASAQQEMSMEA